MQTFQDFAGEWFRQVTANGDSVSQDAIDMAGQAWELATKAEREACAKACEEFGDTLEVDVGPNFAEHIRAR